MHIARYVAESIPALMGVGFSIWSRTYGQKDHQLAIKVGIFLLVFLALYAITFAVVMFPW